MRNELGARRFFAVGADVGDAFIHLADKRNLTLHACLQDILGKVVELDKSGVSLEHALEGFRLFRTAKEMGFVSIPENIWYEIAAGSLHRDGMAMTNLFMEAGDWIGKYALAKSQEEPTRTLCNLISPLVNDASEFSFDGSATLRVRCINSRYSSAYAECFSKLLQRAAETIGYEPERRIVSKGMILLVFRKNPSLETKMRGEILA